MGFYYIILSTFLMLEIFHNNMLLKVLFNTTIEVLSTAKMKSKL